MNTNHTPKNDRTAHTALAIAATSNAWKVGKNFAKPGPVRSKPSFWAQLKKVFHHE